MEQDASPAAPLVPRPKEGDDAQARDSRIRADALARLQALGWDPLPGFSFSREGANERGA